MGLLAQLPDLKAHKAKIRDEKKTTEKRYTWTMMCGIGFAAQ